MASGQGTFPQHLVHCACALGMKHLIKLINLIIIGNQQFNKITISHFHDIIGETYMFLIKEA